MNINKFIEENKVFMSLWFIWMLINFAMWGSVDKHVADFFWFPGRKFPMHSEFYDMWNLPETMIYGFGPLAIYIRINIWEKIKR